MLKIAVFYYSHIMTSVLCEIAQINVYEGYKPHDYSVGLSVPALLWKI